MRTAPSPLLPIFRSDAQGRLLAILYLDPRGPRPFSDVARRAEVPAASAHRELDRLVAAGLLREERIGRQRLVTANEEGPLYGPLLALLERAFGPPIVLREALEDVAGVEFAAIFGSYAARWSGDEGPAPRDLDLLVVGHVDTDQLYAAVEAAEQDIALPVNPTILSPSEWAADTGFVRELRHRPLVRIIGEPT